MRELIKNGFFPEKSVSMGLCILCVGSDMGLSWVVHLPCIVCTCGFSFISFHVQSFIFLHLYFPHAYIASMDKCLIQWFSPSFSSCVHCFHGQVCRHWCQALMPSTDAKHWCQALVQKPGAENWYRKLVQKAGQKTGQKTVQKTGAETWPEHWWRKLVQKPGQKTGAENWCRTLVQHTGATHWCRKLVQKPGQKTGAENCCSRKLVQHKTRAAENWCSRNWCSRKLVKHWFRKLVQKPGAENWRRQLARKVVVQGFGVGILVGFPLAKSWYRRRPLGEKGQLKTQ